ncbi:AEC family transporter [candidate division KSB1 bacterium]|nr:AEC family transporter [candidate division KSB1 bacterium]MBL7092777.1 AEC family transporter [candidate division KSB1 bacterium]
MQNLVFSLNVVAPVFLIIILGVVLKSTKQINENFISISSKIVFNVSMPALVFVELSTADFDASFNVKLLAFINVGTFVFFILAWILALVISKDGRDQGSFIQGSVRSNFVIVGFAIIFNMFGNSGLSKAAIMMAFIMPLYNVLAIVALTVPLHKEKQVGFKKTIWEISTNPLLLAAVLAIPFSLYKIVLPLVLSKSIEYLAAMTLPLALIGIGGSLNFESIKKDSRLAVIATAIKIVLIPLVLTSLAIKFGFRGENLGAMFILFATPTAIASFVMAKAMDCNAELAGNIILLSTLGSVITISSGIFILKSMGYF